MTTRRRWIAVFAVASLAHAACSDEAARGGDGSADLRDASTAPSDTRTSGSDAAGTDTAGGDQGMPSAALCDPVVGSREVVVIPVAFGSEMPDCSEAQLETTWFAEAASVAAFYGQASAGRLTLNGRVVDPVSVTAPTTCIGQDIGQNQSLIQSIYPRIDDAVAGAGITIDADATRVYVLPSSVKCGARGPSATSVPPVNRVLLYGETCSHTQISSHEVGHILGINHAGTVDAAGTVREYGDESDIMGRGFFAPNGPHQAQLGWLSAQRVISVSSTGTFRLAPLGSADPQHPQLLVIDLPGDASQAAYISYRQPTAPDAELPAEFRQRSSIHVFSATCPPADVRPIPMTVLLGTVGDAQQHSLQDTGITIGQLSHDDSGAQVEVIFPGS